MPDPIPLQLHTAEPDPEVIRTLRDALREARRGRYTGVAIAYTGRGGIQGSLWAVEDDRDIAHLNMALDRLKRRLLDTGHEEEVDHGEEE